MRTYAASAADRERDRYAEKKEHDPQTEAGAKAILSNPSLKDSAQQSVLILDKGPMTHEGLPGSYNVMTALETMGAVTRTDSVVMKTKVMTYELTLLGRQIAASAKAAKAKAALRR